MANSPLVSTGWLASNMLNKELVLLDVSFDNVIGLEPLTYKTPKHIPNSHKLDLENTLCDNTRAGVHNFPRPEQVSAIAQKLGITSESTIVLYDNQGIYSAPRGWWIFKSMGFENVFVVDGGLPKWLEEGRPVVSEYLSATGKTEVYSQAQENRVCGSDFVLANLDNPAIKVIDARSVERFAGSVAEPRPGVRSGHIPGAVNLPFARVLHNRRYKSEDALKAIFAELGVESSEQLVFSCGSGVTACILILAAEIAGLRNQCLYDGSWAEWGASDSLPIATST
ncbi:sulfurtransferase [Teredinibacter turnerae]|uniref:sulfurtransferase n=1 Tax=Teredinibacter turnerae TaxID=2426 RepID=UPI0005F7ED81|nr:sulfurtransferase [Teredinibacter turnerae]